MSEVQAGPFAGNPVKCSAGTALTRTTMAAVLFMSARAAPAQSAADDRATVLLIALVLALVVTFIVAVLLALPPALYNRLRHGRFQVGRRARIMILIIALPIGVIITLAGVPNFSYEDVIRFQVDEGHSLTLQYQTPLAEYFRRHGNFDGVSITKWGGTTTGDYVSNISFDGARGVMVAVVATFGSEAHREIRGREFRIATEDGGETWQCGAKIKDPLLRGKLQVDPQLLPVACR